MIILIILIGAKYINQNEFAILSGEMVLEANTSEQASEYICQKSSIILDYPKGFNKDNCVVVSIGRSGVDCISYGWTTPVSAENIFNGVEPISVILYDNNSSTTDFKNKIKIIVGNLSTHEQTITYKIVLMKI